MTRIVTAATKHRLPLPVRYGPTVALMTKAVGLRMPESEIPFAKEDGRRWRLDFGWCTERVGLEVDGGAFVQGRHTRGAGFIADMEKGNALVMRGWKVLRCTPAQLHDLTIWRQLKALVG